MAKPVLLVDFDHTLFDTHSLVARFNSLDEVIDYVQKAESLDEFIYPGAVNLLKSAQKNWQVFLFSEGQLPYQEQKVRKTQLPQLVSQVLIYPEHHKTRQLANLATKYSRLAIVDDKPEVLEAAAKLNLVTIRLKTGKYSQMQSNSQIDFEFSDLEALLKSQVLEKISRPLNKVEKVHFVGIKGVGMTPLALMLQDLGIKVQGSDTPETQITDQVLAKRDIQVSDFSPANITADLDVVIYSGAYKKTVHPELIKAKELGIYTISQAEALATLIAEKKLIAVCGVGGKTTTTGMMAQVFSELNQGGWFVGVSQISQNLVPGKIDDSPFFVAEADEYAITPGIDNRPKFSLYKPQIIICTNLAYDHPDIYPDFEATKKVFAEFFNQLPPEGLLVIKQKDLDLIQDLLKPETKIALVENNHESLELQVIGQMNQLNAQAVMLACAHLKLDLSKVRAGLAKFAGTKRRLELVADQDQIIYLDDYGHHPDEIKLTLAAIKQNYPDKRIRVVFHAHTLTRTKALLQEFGQSFSQADEVLVAPIFTSARETDDQSVTAQKLAEQISKHHHQVQAFDDVKEIVDYLKKSRRPNDLILTLGAGDIYKIHQQLVES